METQFELHNGLCTDRQCEGDCMSREEIVRLVFSLDDALTKVRNLHKETKLPKLDTTFCRECDQDYPCDTIQAVGKQ